MKRTITLTAGALLAIITLPALAQTAPTAAPAPPSVTPSSTATPSVTTPPVTTPSVTTPSTTTPSTTTVPATTPPATPAANNCQAIKNDIAQRIIQNGVPQEHFTLSLAPIEKPAEGRQVGHCGHGQFKILYQKIAR